MRRTVTTEEYVCDRCGADMTRDTYSCLIAAVVIRWTCKSYAGDGAGHEQVADLCSKCAPQLKEWLSNEPKHAATKEGV